MIQEDRVRWLNGAAPRDGRYVLYWMQASCRAECNHALEYAVRLANDRRKPVVACFGLTANFPEATARHYAFLLEGIRDAQRGLERRGIPLLVIRGTPDDVAVEMAREACVSSPIGATSGPSGRGAPGPRSASRAVWSKWRAT
jgi:deoxyribodipyrimidine photo-lyase